MENRNGAEREHDEACQRVASLFQRAWLRGYALGKLRRDAIYSTAYELLRDSPHPILDVGCGVGLLGLYLRERGCTQPVLGLDADARKIECGAATAAGYENLEVRFHDLRNGLPPFNGNIVLFDVLHYLPVNLQRTLLSGLASSVAPDGTLIVRDCPSDPRPRFWMTWLAEKFAQAIRWNLDTALHFPSRASIHDVFARDTFAHETRPLWGRSPFNNHLFIFRRAATAAVRAAV
ncbi:MAG TPA: class I SAM-dependent methyltransferase [Chthoniobacterales bacterium]|jgi:2-polyprenyl-3-methyl-5-hydroxy-6-metoxy-1,4-benzoquinol methylase|nr:class I SAM-dependent methyltransferase [Chthoniobacterales bacterium]